MKIITDKDKIQAVIDSFARTTQEIYSLSELKEILLSGKQLIIKFGVDVTAPDLHIGHAVNMWMQRQLQELGHKIIFLVGDFTTQIGDPTGKNKLRPIIPIDEIEVNAEAFIKQAKMILIDDPNLVEIRKNSEWFNKMPAKRFIELMSLVTNNNLLSRDMFKQRIEEKKEIYEHELIYPILQAYDSFELKSDLTIIGSDQIYNENLGRFYQEKLGQRPQVIITTKITPGIDGREKQSKSLGNYIGLNHTPREKFGRIMSMSDDLIESYLKVYTNMPLEAIEESMKENQPMQNKIILAKEIVKIYHGDSVAEEEAEWFRKTFSERKAPEELKTVHLQSKKATVFEILRLFFNKDVKSNNDLRKLIQQNAVQINGKKIANPNEMITILEDGFTVKVGKKTWFKVKSIAK